MPAYGPSLPSTGGARTYSPDLAPLLQSLLATLADIDFAFESDLELVENSAMNGALKRKTIERLQEQHRARRTPYVRQIDVLQQSVQQLLA